MNLMGNLQVKLISCSLMCSWERFIFCLNPLVPIRYPRRALLTLRLFLEKTISLVE